MAKAETVDMPSPGPALAAFVATLVVGFGAFGFLLQNHMPGPGWATLAGTLILAYFEQRMLPGLRERWNLRQAKGEARRLVSAVRSAAAKEKKWTGNVTREQIEQLAERTLTAADGNDLGAINEQTRKLDEMAEATLTRKPVYREYIEQIGGALLVAALLRGFFYEAFKIPSASMEPTLLVGDHLFVNKYVYGIRIPFTLIKYFTKVPQRGDIVVFNKPGDEGGDDIIKRVIGLPGDVIDVRDRHISVNGVPFETKRLPPIELNDEGDTHATSDEGPFPLFEEFEETVGTHTHIALERPGGRSSPTAEGTWTVEPGHVFVMGNNRDNSADSRFGPEEHGFGQVPLNYIKGRADVIWLSIGGSHGLRFSRMFTKLN